MKTPREILLEKHAHMTSPLDAVRRKTVASLREQKDEQVEIPLWTKLWRELILPCRRIWTGLAVAWVMAAGLMLMTMDYSSGESSHLAVAIKKNDLRVALLEQKQLMAELLFNDQSRPAAKEPESSRLSPRSERGRACLMG
jgi:hypothetical protein